MAPRWGWGRAARLSNDQNRGQCTCCCRCVDETVGSVASSVHREDELLDDGRRGSEVVVEKEAPGVDVEAGCGEGGCEGDDMEAILRRPVHEGEQEMTCTDIVAQVLTKSSTFLRNVGLQQPVAAPKSISPQMQELQAQLEAEKEESAGLRQKVQRLEAQAEESEAKAQKQAEEIENLKKAITDTQKSAADTQNLIRQMIAFGQTQVTHQTTPP
uniref:Uncharacterized protein n=1 Tax=Oryza nivara TaxID=4536 RepID=A0A0E0FMJ4_ORYNI